MDVGVSISRLEAPSPVHVLVDEGLRVEESSFAQQVSGRQGHIPVRCLILVRLGCSVYL